jgi:ABC-type sugar transport system substrate-binding protein
VFWSGQGTQSAAETWAAANGGTTLSVAPNATAAQVAAESANYAANASGNVVVFQSATGVPVGGQWAQTEYGILMSNPNVTGITYNVINESGVTIFTTTVPK